MRTTLTKFSFIVGGSADFHFGDFSSSVSETGPGGSDITVEGRDWNDVYEFGWNIQGEVGYVLTDHIELFGGFRYHRADSDPITQDSAILISGFDVGFDMRWGDYEAWGGELGLRYFFVSKEAKFRPFVSIAGGASGVDDIGLSIDTIGRPGGDLRLYEGAFYDGGIVGTASALLGVEFNVTCHFAVRADAGIRWESGLDQNDTGFETFSGGTTFSNAVANLLHPLNDEDDGHLTIPVSVSAVFRF